MLEGAKNYAAPLGLLSTWRKQGRDILAAQCDLFAQIPTSELRNICDFLELDNESEMVANLDH